MLIIHQDQFSNVPKGSVIALGNFDGIHIGHQEIIKTAVDIARIKNCKVGVLIFNPHPFKVLNKDISHSLLVSFDKRLEKLKNLGIDFVAIQEFTQDFAKLSARDFIEKILIRQLNVGHCISGYNFKFGHKGTGDTRMLAGYHHEFGYTQINQIKYEGFEVSTSVIKKLLKSARIERANRLLASYYCIKGEVIKDQSFGAPIGLERSFTILPDREIILPLFGVYLIRTCIDSNECYGIAYLNSQPELKIQLLDCDISSNTSSLEAEFLTFMRPMRDLENQYQQDVQIKYDIRNANYLLKSLTNKS